jgi:hypothetical protein
MLPKPECPRRRIRRADNKHDRLAIDEAPANGRQGRADRNSKSIEVTGTLLPAPSMRKRMSRTL